MRIVSEYPNNTRVFKTKRVAHAQICVIERGSENKPRYRSRQRLFFEGASKQQYSFSNFPVVSDGVTYARRNPKKVFVGY